jgi:hypothetical protein
MEMFEAESISAVHNYKKRCPRAKIHVKHRVLGLVGSPKRKGLDAVTGNCHCRNNYTVRNSTDICSIGVMLLQFNFQYAPGRSLSEFL